jgi:hypothetical protein
LFARFSDESPSASRGTDDTTSQRRAQQYGDEAARLRPARRARATGRRGIGDDERAGW